MQLIFFLILRPTPMKITMTRCSTQDIFLFFGETFFFNPVLKLEQQFILNVSEYHETAICLVTAQRTTHFSASNKAYSICPLASFARPSSAEMSRRSIGRDSDPAFAHRANSGRRVTSPTMT
jgi:hypothetical protein